MQDVRAAAAHVRAPRSAGRGSVWVGTTTEINPDGDPDGDGQTVSAGDGTLMRSVTVDPTIDFTTAWTPPPSVLPPGEQHDSDRLAAADERLSSRIGEVRSTFLIGREFDPAELRRWISGLGRMANDIRRAARRARYWSEPGRRQGRGLPVGTLSTGDR